MVIRVSVIHDMSVVNRSCMGGDRSSLTLSRRRCAVVLLLIEAPVSWVAVRVAHIIGARRKARRAPEQESCSTCQDVFLCRNSFLNSIERTHHIAARTRRLLALELVVPDACTSSSKWPIVRMWDDNNVRTCRSPESKSGRRSKAPVMMLATVRSGGPDLH